MIQSSPNPGPLPTKPPPASGQSVLMTVLGLPPYKDRHSSIRNVNSPQREAFLALRTAASEAMSGRRWYDGPIALDFVLRAPQLPPKKLTDYLSGIFDTLDGSHGPSFTYLPVLYNDDSQVCECKVGFEQATDVSYVVRCGFL